MKNSLGILFVALGMVSGARSDEGGAQTVTEPAGQLPVLHEVDVLVVGGAAGGVEAAVAAARQGARVFLAAPRPYLGDDICATYRLWLEPDETPATALARKVFAAPPAATNVAGGPRHAFTYTASRAPDAKHADTRPPGRLTDGRWHGASEQSVQYNGDVTLTLDLGRTQRVACVRVLAYQRPGEFEVADVAVSASGDGHAWTPAGVLTNTHTGEAEAAALELAAPCRAQARYLQLAVRKRAEAARILLGEVLVEAAPPASPSTPAAARVPRPVTPMQVKSALDAALLEARVPFLYGCLPSAVLRDAQGQPAGVVFDTRSGPQAVLARVIIDATERAVVARLAGAACTPYPAGPRTFRRVVVGGPACAGAGVSLVPRAVPLTLTGRNGVCHPVHEYELRLPMRDGSAAAFADAEQQARDLTWTPAAVDGSELLDETPPDVCRGRETSAGAWPGPDAVPLGCLQPAGVERLYVLGGCADLSRAAAERLLRPVTRMALGARIGAAAAAQAAALPAPAGVRRAGGGAGTPLPGLVCAAVTQACFRAGNRLAPAEEGRVPVIGTYDVVVVGGGTGGAPAAIAAARQGARTLLLEYLHVLGGVGTAGYISLYYHGNRCGFTSEVDAGVAKFDPKGNPTGLKWDPEHKSEWYRREARKAGAAIWYGAFGAGAVTAGGRVAGVIVQTPQGRGVVLAHTVVDATGNADIAAAAGADCRYTGAGDLAVQGTGLPPRELGQKYTNTDYTFVDDTDAADLWRITVMARQKFKGAYDLGQLVDSRERRQIVGDVTLSPMDMLLRRTFPDTIVIARSNFDSHGYTVHPLFMVRPPDRKSVDVQVPYRCLLPRGIDGMLVTGLAVSAHRDAIPCIRMQPDVQNQGYAAGVAAALCARRKCATRELDLQALQQHLVRVGNLPETAVGAKDSFPLPRARVVEAVRSVAADYAGLEVVLSHADTAVPLLREALAKSDDSEAQLRYAHVLGMLGDPSGAEVLAKSVAAAPGWDKGWRYTGMGQFGLSLSPLDSFVVALGRTRVSAALPPLLDKARQLSATSEFSHVRATALALESLADPAAAPVLAAALRLQGVGGHAVTNIAGAVTDIPPSGTDTSVRNAALAELYLARALYRCGDCDGLGARTLRQYAEDLHGHYARHARAVLVEKPAASGTR